MRFAQVDIPDADESCGQAACQVVLVIVKPIPMPDIRLMHRDHCSLTGLIAALYTSAGCKPAEMPDPDAGLYVQTRNGHLQQVRIPPDHIAYQMGEATQVTKNMFLELLQLDCISQTPIFVVSLRSMGHPGRMPTWRIIFISMVAVAGSRLDMSTTPNLMSFTRH